MAARGTVTRGTSARRTATRGTATRGNLSYLIPTLMDAPHLPLLMTRVLIQKPPPPRAVFDEAVLAQHQMKVMMIWGADGELRRGDR